MIALITPTGARPKQFALCAKYMQAQNYTGEVLWIIVDDCKPRVSKIINAKKEFIILVDNAIDVTDLTCTNDFKHNWTVVKIYPTPEWEVGQNTQARNLQVGVDAIKQFPGIQAIFIIEDDDWYSPKYLSEMVKSLWGYQIAGEINTIYYNTVDHTIKKNHNTKHSSLFQTAFTMEALPDFEKVLTTNVKYIDIYFYRNAKKVNLMKQQRLSVGIKGLPGRAGIGQGHKVDPVKAKQKLSFADCMKLKELIGMDYINYL